MQIKWEESALDDLESIADYIMQDNPCAAIALAAKLRSAATPLLDHPALGRAGRAPQTREMVISGTAYILIYRFEDNAIRILRVMHGARQWPEQ